MACPAYVHPTADVQTVSIGAGTTIWQFCVVLKDAVIGSNVNICSHCFIENAVRIGNNVTVKNGVCLFDGITHPLWLKLLAGDLDFLFNVPQHAVRRQRSVGWRFLCSTVSRTNHARWPSGSQSVNDGGNR